MECATCGNSLAPGSPYCPRCGASTAPAAPAGPNGSASQPEGSAPEGWNDLTYQSGPPRQARTAFYGRYGSRNSFAPPAPSSLTPSVTPQLTLPQHNTAASEPAPAQPASAGPEPQAGSPALSLSNGGPALLTSELARPSAPARILAPPKPQRPLAGRLIALGSILLLIALLVGMGVFGFRAYKSNQAQARAAATAGAHANATATAVTQARATATALLFSDPLTSNANGWMEDGTYSYFQNNQYYLHNPNPTQTFNAYYEQQTFSDFKAQITITADTNADPNSPVPFAYGLVLRADPTTPSNKYVFFVSPDGTYDFASHDANGFQNNGWTDLVPAPWAKSSAIHTGKGAINTLMVKAVGNTFSLFINGQQIASFSDSNGGYTSGWIGVMVEGADMQASFSNLRVYGPGL